MNFKSFRENRIEICEKIYLIYFAIMIGARAYGLYEGMTSYTVVLVTGMLLFALKVVVSDHTLKEYLVMAVFFFVAGMVYLHSGEKGLIVCFTMLFGMKGVSRKKVIATGAVTAGAIVFIRMIIGILGLTKEVYYPQVRDGIGFMFRHSLGYAHPNTLHMNVLILGMMVMYLVTSAQRYYLESGKKSKKEAVIAVALFSAAVFLFNFYTFQYSGSRTGILACFVYLFCNMWLFVRGTTGILEKIVLYISFPGVCFLGIVIPLILPENSLYEFLNMTVFNNRFMLIRLFWEGNSVSLWGTRLFHKDNLFPTYGIDTAQMYLFLQLGLVAFALIAALTMWFIHYGIRNSLLPELAVLLGVLFLGIWEPLLYNLSFKNITYVFMGAALYAYLEGRELKGEEYGSFLDLRISRRTVGAISLSIVTGIAAAMVYMLLTATPTALYGDRQELENGKSLGMQEYYLTADEIYDLRADGELIVGYVDEATPMYRYDSVIADMEYKKKILSAGVWCSMLMLGICLIAMKTVAKSVAK